MNHGTVIHYLNGKFIDGSKALIKVNELGLLRGYGIFDYFRTYDRKPFHLEDHLRRFFKSAAAFNLKPPFSVKEIERIVLELIKRNKNFRELGFRIVLTGGETADGKTSARPTFFIMVARPSFSPKEVYSNGVRILTFNYRREFPEIKTTNYLLAVSRWRDVLRKKAAEILYVWQGKVLEASTSNFFMVKNKILFTSKTEILKGVTRKLVIKLAKKNKIKIVEKDIYLKEALEADECFMTATDKEIMPVVRIDRFKIKNGRVGEITEKLIEFFKEHTENFS
ncbi:hypothetical protein A3G50_01250 [Candidatus Jorgensenbacteria bacterium RIFCSPLOWO2_12_FULL_42_11]|uniref:Amino acid aminotransferase n=1 Tax=Candidatus Jorgensenbacteria bacterium RIFCSPLOWO2_12_FULL_42_11 TaxID=1798473 RepID=A0A1F6C243_9BACT|nr:MAG: hypothetical protein A3G50_01250 [Candidatus Jorgensenbacteria bacterium RIFCSPLOWO2_12_FULL_42_11]